MSDVLVQLFYFVGEQGFKAGGGAVFHKFLYFVDGHVQLPQKKDGFQDGALAVAVAAIAVFWIDDGRFEQSDFVVPHESFLVDSVKRGELADGQQLVFFIHFTKSPLDRTVTV